MTNDRTLREFYDRAAECFPGLPPKNWDALRYEAETRSRAGRALFQFAYMGRDNIGEATEEVADFMNYLYMERLRVVRRTGETANDDLLFQAIYHAAMADHYAREYRFRNRAR